MSEASLSIQPFETTRCDFRAIVIPASLGDDDRRRFITRVREAVDQQVELAKRCETVLRVTGEVREEGGRLIVPHEPCSALNPQLLTQTEDRTDIDTLWWLTWSLARSLAAAEQMQITHGGVQAASVYRNELGVVKLGDFGIAPAFESACGVDARRHVACCPDPAPEGTARRASGVWALLDDDEPHEYGWIAPYFGHELLEGRRRLNPKSDQFAMGTVLFLWASGTHPYGVELSDPNLLAYFQLEPFSFEDERRDWQEAFEKTADGLANKAQQSIVAWSDLVALLLSSEHDQRFKSLNEAVKLVGEHANPDAWSDALERVSRAAAELDKGDVDAFLGHVQPLAEDGALPAIWQTCLAEYVTRAEADKEVIARRKALERRLDQGRAALDAQDMAEARTIAEEVKSASECDDALRDGADDLLEMCASHEALVRSGAVELAKQNLQGAREALEQEDFQEAHRFCDLVLHDALVPAELRQQAEQLLTELESAEAAAAEGAQSLVHVSTLVRDGKLPEAQQTLEQLLQKERLPESVAQQARLHLADITQTLEKTEQLTGWLDQIEQAIEQVDTDTADELLAEHSTRSIPKSLRPRRDSLAERRMNLNALLKRRHEAEELFARNDPRGAAEVAADLSKQEGIPAALRDELAQFIDGCEQAMRDADKAALERAVASLEKAAQCLNDLNVSRCRDLLEGSVLSCDQLDSQPRQQAETMLEACGVVETALASLNAAREQMSADHFDDAKAALLKLPTEGLPKALTDRAAELLSEIQEHRDRFIQEQRERLRALVADAGREIDQGELKKAENLLKQVTAAAEVPDEIQADVEGLRQKLAKLKPLAALLDQAAQAVDQDQLERAEKLLADAPGEPEWLARRAAEIAERLATARDRDRRAAVERAEQVLDAAEAALARCDPQAALGQLKSASTEIELDKRLKKRRDAVTAEAERIGAWLPKIQSASSALESGDAAETYRICKKHADAQKPAPVAARLKEIQEQAAAQIAARQAEIKNELSQLTVDIERRKARAPRVRERTEAISSDALAAKVQKEQAAELLATFEAFPPPKSRAPAIAIATVAIAVVGAAAFYFTRPITPEQLLADLHDEATTAALAHYQQQGRKDFNLELNPSDTQNSSLDVLIAGAPAPVTLCGIRDGESDTPNWTDQLIPLLYDPQKLRDGLNREANQAADDKYQNGRKAFTLKLTPPNAYDAQLAAVVGTGADASDVPLGTLDQGRAPSDWTNRLLPELEFPPTPPPVEKLPAWKSKAEAEAQSKHPNGFKRFGLKFDQDERTPATLIAFLVDDPTQEIRLGPVVDSPPDNWLANVANFVEPDMPVNPPDDEIYEKLRAAFVAKLIDESAGIAKITDLDLTGSPQVRPILAVAKYDRRELLSLSLSYDKARTPPFSPDATQAARHFLLQARAFAALAAANRLPVTLPARFAEYEDKARITQSVAAALVRVDDSQQPPIVELRSTAVLSGDDRANETFSVSITYSDDGKLTARAADNDFTDYLASLQQQRAPTAPPAQIGREAVPAGLTVSAAILSPDGSTADVDLLGAANTKLVTLRYEWEASQLAYRLDEQSAARDIRALLVDPAAAAGGWTALRESLSPDARATGVGYFNTLELIDAKPSGNGIFSVDTTLEIGPPSAAANDVGNITVAARVALTGGRPQLGVANPAGAAANVVRQLSGKAADLRFLDSRAAQAEREFKTPVQSRSLKAGPPPTLSAAAADGTIVSWSWNNSGLLFDNPKTGKPPGSKALELLAGLAGPISVTDAAQVDRFVEALKAVTDAKCLRYSKDKRYVPATSLANAQSGAGLETLLQISRRLQTLTGRTTGAFPLLFVEYYVEKDEVFGLGWRTEADTSDTISNVVEMRVWRVDVNRPDANALLEYRDDCKSNQSLAASLLPMLPQNPQVSPDGAWGVIVAPDDFLWMTPWADLPIAGKITSLRFGPVNQQLPLQDVSYGRLGDLLGTKEARKPGRRDAFFPRVGIWCAPCLAGEQGQKRVFPPESPFDTYYVFKKTGLGPPFYVLHPRAARLSSPRWNSRLKLMRGWRQDGLHFWTTDFAEREGIIGYAIVQPQP